MSKDTKEVIESVFYWILIILALNIFCHLINKISIFDKPKPVYTDIKQELQEELNEEARQDFINEQLF